MQSVTIFSLPKGNPNRSQNAKINPSDGLGTTSIAM